MSYEQSWGDILSKAHAVSLPALSGFDGELADISCGDPWYRKVEPDDAGRSLVLVRTGDGPASLHEAMKAATCRSKRSPPTRCPCLRHPFCGAEAHLWGRLAALRVLGAAVPAYRGFSLYANWRTLPLGEKLRSLLGTARRTVQRKWYRREREGMR
jgi:coenzyme F420 hydrogenase subunit beta